MNLLYVKAFLATRDTFRQAGQQLGWFAFVYSGEARRSIRRISPEQADTLARLRWSCWIFGPVWILAFLAITIAGAR